MSTSVPKILWMLWFQGWDDPPPLVRACRRSWEQHHPDWDVRLLDARAVDHLPRVADLRGAAPAAASDIARAHVLREHGGVWVDATSFCVRPLDSWLLPRLGVGGFFAFRAPGYQRMVSSWLLASAPEGLVIVRWAEAADRYWLDRDQPDEYFWFHYLFTDLYRVDARFRVAWDEAPHLSADGPHYFAPYDARLTGPMSRRVQARLAAGTEPVYKLTNRVDPTGATPDSAYRWFLGDGVVEPTPSIVWQAADHALVTGRSRAKRAVNRIRERLPRRP